MPALNTRVVTVQARGVTLMSAAETRAVSALEVDGSLVPETALIQGISMSDPSVDVSRTVEDRMDKWLVDRVPWGMWAYIVDLAVELHVQVAAGMERFWAPPMWPCSAWHSQALN